MQLRGVSSRGRAQRARGAPPGRPPRRAWWRGSRAEPGDVRRQERSPPVPARFRVIRAGRGARQAGDRGSQPLCAHCPGTPPGSGTNRRLPRRARTPARPGNPLRRPHDSTGGYGPGGRLTRVSDVDGTRAPGPATAGATEAPATTAPAATAAPATAVAPEVRETAAPVAPAANGPEGRDLAEHVTWVTTAAPDPAPAPVAYDLPATAAPSGSTAWPADYAPAPPPPAPAPLAKAEGDPRDCRDPRSSDLVAPGRPPSRSGAWKPPLAMIGFLVALSALAAGSTALASSRTSAKAERPSVSVPARPAFATPGPQSHTGEVHPGHH